MKSVGFVGLGHMGGPMASNVLKHAGNLMVFDRDSARVARCVEKGARAAHDVRSLAESVDVVVTSLPGPREVQAVSEGDEGLIAGLRRDALWIDMTTNDPQLVRSLEKTVRERGAFMLDAPVTGAVDGARRGSLAIFVGGMVSVYDRAAPLLRSMGTQIMHCGDIGAGNVVKLVTNQLWFINAAAIGEALVLGMRSGIDILTLWSAIKSSVGTSFVAEHDVPSILMGHYDPSFSLDLCMKDLNLIASLAKATSVPVEVTAKAHTLFAQAQAKYGGSSGELHVVKLIEDATGTELRAKGTWAPPWEA